MGLLDSLTNSLGALAGTTEGNGQIPDVIAMSPESPIGYRQRELMSWRVPGIGYVQMYINPQECIVGEKKGITRQRTKGGFVVQYWGEEPTNIKITGTTGTSGIEGINVLRNVYRSEQLTFRSISDKLASNLIVFKSTIDSNKKQNALVDSDDTSFIPTLGSLALSVELYYQGLIYKGYFEDFSVTESVANGVGIFTYSMTFIALERKGFRTNFMPWHRSAQRGDYSYNSANSKISPYSFKGEYNK